MVRAGHSVERAQVQRGRATDGPAANAPRGAYNLVMLIATVVSAIAAIAALVPH